MYKNMFLLTSVLICAFSLGFSEEVIVEIESGLIRGRKTVTPNHTVYYAFQEIPYASPPVGLLRFQPPKLVQKWSGILNTTQNTKICYQADDYLEMENEDCLYLNVYTPQLRFSRKSDRLPVLFFIHGGGFMQGDGTFSSFGPDFLIEHDLVIVTINYRLGPFGFLSTQDDVIPGNNGLKDQLVALKWTHRNIEQFGGDPEKVTIVGQSVGAASVGYHLISEKSKGLFRGAIMESGSALSPFAFQRNAREFAFKTASLINSTFGNSGEKSSEELLQFLLSTSAENIDLASFVVVTKQYANPLQLSEGYCYTPVIELDRKNGFLTDRMFEILSAGNASRVPILIGLNSEEGLSWSTSVTILKLLMRLYDEHQEWFVPDDLNLSDTTNKIEVGSKIREIYCGKSCLLHSDPAASLKFLSDISFTRGIIKHADLQSEFSTVFFYQFSYDGVMGNVSTVVEGADRVGHSEELPYLWRINSGRFHNYDQTKFPALDILVQKRMVLLWTNFVKTLNPTPKEEGLLLNVTWPATRGKEDFLYLDISDNLLVKKNPKEKYYRSWEEIYRVYGRRPFDTY